MSEPNDDKASAEHLSKWQVFKDETKKFGKWYIIGTLAILAFGLIGPIGNLIGIQGINIDKISSTSDLYNTFFIHTTWQTALFTAASVVSVGGVVVFLSATQTKFGKLLRLRKDAVIDDAKLDKEIKDKLKKLRFLPLITFGIYMGVLFVAVGGVVFVTTGVNLGNINSFLGGYYSLNITTIVIESVAIAFYAFLMKHFESEYEKLFNKIEPYVKKTRFL